MTIKNFRMMFFNNIDDFLKRWHLFMGLSPEIGSMFIYPPIREVSVKGLNMAGSVLGTAGTVENKRDCLATIEPALCRKTDIQQIITKITL